MKAAPPFSTWALCGLLLCLSLAAGTRGWYVARLTEMGQARAPLQVQGAPSGLLQEAPDRPTEHLVLVTSVAQNQSFDCEAPLAASEPTAHVAPGYAWLRGTLTRFPINVELALVWTQVALGVLTVACLFLFVRRAFHSAALASLAGVLGALYPFWIINTAEINDGVLTCFLLTATLALGARGSQVGGPFTSLIYGLTLAGLAMLRAALLPFALVALIWYLWSCRDFRLGWFAALLAILGFANGLAPWSVRNFQTYDRPIPIVTSTYFHLWMGSNPKATGGVLDEATLRSALAKERLDELLGEKNQAKRYARMREDLQAELTQRPSEALAHRLDSARTFFLGELWTKEARLARVVDSPAGSEITERTGYYLEWALRAWLFALFALALLGWRFSHAWRRTARIAAYAALWIPLPYLLSHGEAMSGPRLPWDAVLICFASYGLIGWLPAFKPTAGKEKPAEG